MKLADDIAAVSASAVITIADLPTEFLNWPAAYRLRPARLPATEPLALLGEEAAALLELKALTEPTPSNSVEELSKPSAEQRSRSEAVAGAFRAPLPEWRFARRGTPHIVLANSLEAALHVASEIYGQFMLDTGQGRSVMSFVVERYRLSGNFADVRTVADYPACYDPLAHYVPQRLVADLLTGGRTGLLYSAGAGEAVVALPSNKIIGGEIERALALEWDGIRFARSFDYRDMYWRDIENVEAAVRAE